MPDQPFKKLSSYFGPLTPEQAVAGINAARENALALYEEAAILLEHQRWARASSLSILSIEESGKTTILRSVICVTEAKQLREEWKQYRSHTSKNIMGGIIQFLQESPHLLDFAAMYSEDAEHTRLIDAVKQIGFYSDCLGAAHWSIPKNVINEKLARQFHLTAKCLLNDCGFLGTIVGLQLWIKHLKPVWGTAGMKQALLECYAEAADLGLVDPEEAKEMTRFVL